MLEADAIAIAGIAAMMHDEQDRLLGQPEPQDRERQPRDRRQRLEPGHQAPDAPLHERRGGHREPDHGPDDDPHRQADDQADQARLAPPG